MLQLSELAGLRVYTGSTVLILTNCAVIRTFPLGKKSFR
jgi:hypothetical protein